MGWWFRVAGMTSERAGRDAVEMGWNFDELGRYVLRCAELCCEVM